MIDEAASSECQFQTNDADRRWVEYVLAHKWIMSDSRAPMAVTLGGRNDIAIGAYHTTLQALIAARPNASVDALFEFCLTHDAWKILPLKLYRPLVYYAAFGTDDIFGCLRAAIVSLLEFGRWDHEIGILTRTEDLVKVNTAVADLNLGNRLHIVTVPGADILDWCLARYRIDAVEIVATHQPILYLDVDVICDAPLDDLCLQLTHSRTIEVLPEGRLDEGDPDSSGHWFGWRLMAADGLDFDPLERGFSSGILGFANKKIAAQAFSAILRSAYHHSEQVGDRHRFAGYDQPFAGYVLKKLRLTSSDLLPAIAQFCRVDPATMPLPMPVRPSGLVHFNGIVGDASAKRRAMEHYLAALYARRKRGVAHAQGSGQDNGETP